VGAGRHPVVCAKLPNNWKFPEKAQDIVSGKWFLHQIGGFWKDFLRRFPNFPLGYKHFL
jgi:hypothetical protein